VPFLALMLIGARGQPWWLLAGMAAALPAEALRFWAARSIGPASRTRGDTPGPLARSGPYRLSRNPLYLANIALYASFALATGWWLAVLFPVLAVPYYQFIVGWEERRLFATHGADYQALLDQVPRWLGRPKGAPPPAQPNATWNAALRAERGTLMAMLAVFGSLTAKLLLLGS
jgi:protein-S-isoprenylcysteine O-methyltransferase Ste14